VAIHVLEENTGLCLRESLSGLKILVHEKLIGLTTLIFMHGKNTTSTIKRPMTN
jgi:hypothetical protein